MPKSITLLQGEKLKLAKMWGIDFKEINSTILETASNLNQNKVSNVRKNRYGYKSIPDNEYFKSKCKCNP